jgi:hypothetical protein
MWGMLCLTLIAFWPRSYRSVDTALLLKPGTAVGVAVVSDRGQLVFASTAHWSLVADIRELKLDSHIAYPDMEFVSGYWKFGYRGGYRESRLAAPHWFAILIAGSLSATPWIRRLGWRFSLRTLLIAMTLLAVGLGWAVYVLRN